MSRCSISPWTRNNKNWSWFVSISSLTLHLTDPQIKRKFAVRGVAGATPLGTSRKANLDTPTTEIETPAPGRLGIATRRRSSAAFVTPSMGSVGGEKMLKGGHGTDLWKSNMTKRTMKKVEEENKAPMEYPAIGTRGSVRRERMPA